MAGLGSPADARVPQTSHLDRALIPYRRSSSAQAGMVPESVYVGVRPAACDNRRGMQRSTQRILTTHVGSLARPHPLLKLMQAQVAGEPYDEQAFASLCKQATQPPTAACWTVRVLHADTYPSMSVLCGRRLRWRC